MSLIGIVCEFNPFHNGHKYLIDSVKGENDTVVCVMSGNFVQRCEPAIFPKEIRVSCALENGVDIVFELPFVYSCASAEIFCENAVKILSDFGCDKIVFGTENGNLTQLKSTAQILLSEKFEKILNEYRKTGLSYPNAREKALDFCGASFELSSPNDILAVEYIKAIIKNGYKIQPIAVKRKGVEYHSLNANGDFASATLIRKLIYDKCDYDLYVDRKSAKIYRDAVKSGETVNRYKYENAMMALLRNNVNQIDSDFANMTEGLENRIKEAIINGTSLDEIYTLAKTKRYTHSRIRRAVMSVAFGIKKKDVSNPVPYIRLLGFNESACEVLGKCVKNCALPFIVSYSDIKKSDNENVVKTFEYESVISDFYALILDKTKKCSLEKTYFPVKIK